MNTRPNEKCGQKEYHKQRNKRNCLPTCLLHHTQIQQRWRVDTANTHSIYSFMVIKLDQNARRPPYPSCHSPFLPEREQGEYTKISRKSPCAPNNVDMIITPPLTRHYHLLRSMGSCKLQISIPAEFYISFEVIFCLVLHDLVSSSSSASTASAPSSSATSATASSHSVTIGLLHELVLDLREVVVRFHLILHL